ncbi:MAG: CRISPR-associated helicase Cas3' [Pseudoclavibacter sp.]|nr:CRISPR-associated helicase Cas3' [Pseudoclavibacter sp.]
MTTHHLDDERDTAADTAWIERLRREHGLPWGKREGREQPLPLLSHLLDSAAAARALWRHWLRAGLRELIARAVAGGDQARAEAMFMLCAGLHDLGKAGPVFQGQLFAEDAVRAEFAGISGLLREAGLDMSASRSSDSLDRIVRRHEALGMALLTSEGRWPYPDERVGADWAAVAVGAHHGRFWTQQLDDQSFDEDLAYCMRLASGSPRWSELRGDLLARLEHASGVRWRELRVDPGPAGPVLTLLGCGFVQLADWLASSMPCGPETDFHDRCAFYETALPHTIGLPVPINGGRERILGRFASTPRAVQLALEELRAGLVVVTETTGGGKTEAALLRQAALGSIAMIFALPTRVTSDAMWRRVLAAFEDSGAVGALLHEYRALDAFYRFPERRGTGGVRSTDWLENRGHALLAPLATSTIDQVLMAALRRRNITLRLLSLANRHVVLDEVHNYDPYQAELLKMLLAWWGRTGTPVTMLSATLPRALHDAYRSAYADVWAGQRPAQLPAPCSPGVSVTAAPNGWDPGDRPATRHETIAVRSERRYRLPFRLHEHSEPVAACAARLALRRRATQPRAAIGIVVNRVDTAIETARELIRRGEHVLVLHSRMSAAHRARTSRALGSVLRPGGARDPLVVVGTQVLESSLDIDFDVLLSELAPAASLAQRAGRLWRHSTPGADGAWRHPAGRDREGEPVLELLVRVRDGELSEDTLPYPYWQLDRTLAWLRGHRSDPLRIPEDVQGFVDAAHFESGRIETYLEDAEGRSTSPVFDLMRNELDRVKAAQETGMQGIGRPDEAGGRVLLSETGWKRGAQHGDLGALATPDSRDTSEVSAGTRFEEVPSVHAVLCDPDGPSSAVWRGDPADVERAAEPARRLRVLEHSLPVSASFAEKHLRTLDGGPVLVRELEERRRSGHGRGGPHPLRLGPGAVYDEVLGLTTLPASPADSERNDG